MTYIYDQINSESHFYHWLQKSANYKNNFSYNGADAVQSYYQELAENQDEPIEFDPIAWCCTFSEYSNLEAVKTDYNDIDTMDDLHNQTIVISESPIVFMTF